MDRFPAFSVSLLHGARAITAVLLNLDSGFTKQCATPVCRLQACSSSMMRVCGTGKRQQPHQCLHIVSAVHRRLHAIPAAMGHAGHGSIGKVMLYGMLRQVHQ